MLEQQYIKTAQGDYIPDRRSNTTMELQQSILKILSKVETMETNIETKLEAHTKVTTSQLELVTGKISNLEEKVFNNIEAKAKQIEDLEKKILDHCEDDNIINSTLDEHDKKWESAKSYIDRIQELERKYIILDSKVTALEQAPVVKKAGIVDGISSAIKNAIFLAIGVGVVGILGMILLQYIRGL